MKSKIHDNPIFMGFENEYAVFGHGDKEDRQRFAADLLKQFQEQFDCLPSSQGNGVFSGIGRFYIDGCHPEYSCPEVTDLISVLYYNRLFETFSRYVSSTLYCNRLYLGKQSGCYLSHATWGQHENYLASSFFPELSTLLYPFLCTRVLFTGSGGLYFNSNLSRVQFTLSPRAHFISDDISRSNRPLFYSKQDNQSGARRVHLFSGINLTENCTYLKFGTTALVLRIAETKPELFRDIPAIKHPTKTMQELSLSFPFSRNIKICKTNGNLISPIEVQRYYLDICEKQLDSEIIPAWAGEVIAFWTDILDRLEQGTCYVNTLLDWRIKYTFFQNLLKQEYLSFAELKRSTIPDRIKYILIKADYDFSSLTSDKNTYDTLLSERKIENKITCVPKVDLRNIWLPVRGRATQRASLIEQFKGLDYACNWSIIQDKNSSKRYTLTDPTIDNIRKSDNRIQEIIDRYS